MQESGRTEDAPVKKWERKQQAKIKKDQKSINNIIHRPKEKALQDPLEHQE